MMINRVKFEAEVKNSISVLKVELQATVKNSFGDFKVAFEALTAKWKDVVDCMNKMKPDGDSLKPSSDFTHEIDADLEVIPIVSKTVSDFTLHSSISTDSNLADEENYRSTNKIQVSHMDEAGFEIEVKKYNGDSTFLAYQEGKPFISTYDFLNDFGKSQGTGVRVQQRSNYNTLNLLSSDEFWQFDDWKLISNDNLNQFISYLLKILNVFFILKTIRITSVILVSSNSEYGRMPFDRGKEFVVGEICSFRSTARRGFKLCLEMLASCWVIPVDKYDEKLLYELVLQPGYQLDSRLMNSVVFILVREGDSCYHRNLFAKMSLRNSITCYACDCILFVPGMIELGYVHILESSTDCFCSSMDFSQRVFDPGKEIDVLRSGNCVYELILGVGYCFEVLFEYLYVFLFGINGDSGNASMLVGKITQLECAPRDKLILQSTRNSKSGNEWSLHGQESLERVVGIKKMLVKTNGSSLKWFFMLIIGSSSLITCGSSARSSNKVESVLQMSRETENRLSQEFFDQILVRKVSFPTHMGEIQKGLFSAISNSIQHLLNCTSMIVGGLFLICARSGKCPCNSLFLARTLIDRGKLFEAISRDCVGRVLYRGRWLGTDYRLIQMVPGGGVADTATAFVKTPRSCRGFYNPFLVVLAKLLVIAKLRCGVFKMPESVMVNMSSREDVILLQHKHRLFDTAEDIYAELLRSHVNKQ